MCGGAVFMAAAIVLSVYNLWDEERAGDAAGLVLEQMAAGAGKTETDVEAAKTEIPDYILNPDMEMPTEVIDGNAYIGILEIPSLGISLPVISDWSEAKLKTAPCRYTGSAYKGNLVIAGHNYKTHLGPIGRLRAGDAVTFTDIDGNVFRYETEETQILGAESVREMTDSEWDLTLFTCTLGGQNRLTVRCRAEKIPEPGI